MRLGVLPMLVAMPLLLVACGDDDESNDNTFFPPTGAHEGGLQVFDDAALEGPNGIERILSMDYKIENIDSIDCPADQEVKVGSKFTCTVTQGGDDPKELTVEITVVGDDGTYQVALPEEK